MPEHRVLLLTGDQRRHSYAACSLAETGWLVGVLAEEKAIIVKNKAALPTEDAAVIDRHFAERHVVERLLLGDEVEWPNTEVCRTEHGGANSPEIFEWVQTLAPDVIVLYGTSIIKPPLLDLYDGRMINLHLGLSPYYRGSGTNFWPLVNGEPECVGATLHLAVAKVDAGPILSQVRPDAAIGDRAHDLGTKTIKAALHKLPQVIDQFLAGKLTPQKQDLSQGKVYRRRDFNADAVRTMWHNFEYGMLEVYLNDQQARQQAYPLIGLR
ncbi:MAG TPA: formyl transferase [Rhodothermales bacterium]|nr:formyl transferase [Rhodothermales bacterium]